MRSTHGEHTNTTLAHGGTITGAAVRYWRGTRTSGGAQKERGGRAAPFLTAVTATHESAWRPNAGSLYAWPAWIRGSSFEGAAFEGAAYCVGRW